MTGAMFDLNYEEHLAHSAPCASRWDGYDRGDLGRENEQENLTIKRTVSASAAGIYLFREDCDDICLWTVEVDGRDKCFATEEEARAYARRLYLARR